jgi:hypothetical protein
LLALIAALMLSAPSAQADDFSCGFASFPTLGKIHRFLGQPVGYHLANDDSRYFDATIQWSDGQFDGAPLYPGDQYDFSHSYSSPGSYNLVLFVSVADPTSAVGVCKTSFALGTVRVRGRGPH